MAVGLVSPVMVGPDAQLAVLDQVLGGARAGSPAVVLPGGEAGAGKKRWLPASAGQPGQEAPVMRQPERSATRPEAVMSLPEPALHPYLAQADEHQRLAYTGGHELAIILDAAVTGGQLSVIDTHARRGDASPVHVHSRDDEAFLLLEGAMTVWAGDQRHRLAPGGVAFLPRHIPHAVRYDIASRALVISMPAGPQEGVFRAAGWDLSRPLPGGWQPGQDALRRAAEQNGVTLTGPPHALDD